MGKGILQIWWSILGWGVCPRLYGLTPCNTRVLTKGGKMVRVSRCDDGSKGLEWDKERMQVASTSWKRQVNGFCPDTSRRNIAQLITWFYFLKARIKFLFFLTFFWGTYNTPILMYSFMNFDMCIHCNVTITQINILNILTKVFSPSYISPISPTPYPMAATSLLCVFESISALFVHVFYIPHEWNPMAFVFVYLAKYPLGLSIVFQWQDFILFLSE